jgi:hypothetical protein
MSRRRSRKNTYTGRTIRANQEERLRMSEVLVGGLALASCSVAGAHIGRKKGHDALYEAREKREKVKKLEETMMQSGKAIVKQLMPDEECDPCKQELKELLKEYKVDECSECGKALMDTYRRLREADNHVIKTRYEHSIKEMLGINKMERDIREAEGAIPKKTFNGAAIGIVPGLVLTVLAVTAMRVTRREMARIRMKKKNEESALRKEEMRRRQIEEAAKKKEAKSDRREESGVKEMLRPVDSAEIHLERLVERKEMERKLEKAIRRICSRRCSEHVAFAIMSELPDNKAEELISRPEKLAGVLVENNVKLGPVLEIHGWEINEVLAEIEKRQRG